MEPRILKRTHYQVNEPAYMEFVVRECTHPTKSAYKESVSKRLQDRLPKRWALNRAAAAYAVDMAAGLGLIGDNYSWTQLGILIAVGSDADLSDPGSFEVLSGSRRLAMCRVLLEGDGAAIWYLLRIAAERGSIRPGGEAANDMAADMYIGIVREYLELTSSIQGRMALRAELKRLQSDRYSGNTGRHKLLFHVNSLHRLGFFAREDDSSLEYTLSELGLRATETLLDRVPTIAALERIVQRQELMTLTTEVLAGPSKEITEPEGEYSRMLTAAYGEVISLGLSLAPVALLLDLVELRLAEAGTRVPRTAALDELMALREKHPRKIRFHVDRKGRPAYVIMEIVDDDGWRVDAD